MEYMDWKLTSEEEEKCRLKGISLGKAQEAKKQAYLDAGGVILNPDALSDLYEALKKSHTLITAIIPDDLVGESAKHTMQKLIVKALAKARVK